MIGLSLPYLTEALQVPFLIMDWDIINGGRRDRPPMCQKLCVRGPYVKPSSPLSLR
jgi:hypothetical protein